MLWVYILSVENVPIIKTSFKDPLNFRGEFCTLTPFSHDVISKIVTQNITTAEMTFKILHIYIII